jgi:hypothetical protein
MLMILTISVSSETRSFQYPGRKLGFVQNNYETTEQNADQVLKKALRISGGIFHLGRSRRRRTIKTIYYGCKKFFMFSNAM